MFREGEGLKKMGWFNYFFLWSKINFFGGGSQKNLVGRVQTMFFFGKKKNWKGSKKNGGGSIFFKGYKKNFLGGVQNKLVVGSKI